MEVRVTLRLWLLGAFLLLAFSMAGGAVLVYTQDDGACTACYGRLGTACPDCAGMREVYQTPDYLSLLVDQILHARRELGDGISEYPGFVSMIAALALLLASLRMVDCRSCHTSGLLDIPWAVRRRARFVQGSCVDCGGRGQLTLIDRWAN